MNMQAQDIDDEGNYHYNGKVVSLLGHSLPIPNDVTKSGEWEEEEVLAVWNVPKSTCSACNAPLTKDITILMTLHYRLVPSRCCNKMIWYMEMKQ